MDKNDTLGTAIRYKSPIRKQSLKPCGKKIYIEDAALSFLNSLNGYEKLQVCKGIERLGGSCWPLGGLVNKNKPNFVKASVERITVFNSVVHYHHNSDCVLVVKIEFLSCSDSANQRSGLYKVKKLTPARLTDKSTLNEIAALEDAWIPQERKANVQTKYAAVNGMLNDLQKASWLMGVHLESAYNVSQLDSYTLFHNPTEGVLLDGYECARDKLGVTTKIAKHLATVLHQIQQSTAEVNWVVHSQGGILFSRAVKHHLDTIGTSLSKNRVVFHASGMNRKWTDKVLKRAGIQKSGADRDNPFDLVPQVLACNNMSPKSIARCGIFLPKVMGWGVKSNAESPHTLPYLSLESYSSFLSMSGNNRSAKRVKRMMNKTSSSNIA